MSRKIGIYVRVACDEESAAANIAIQNEKIAAHLRTDDVIVNTYEDIGASGMELWRPGMKRLLDDVAHGKVDTVVVSDLTRITRKFGLLEEFLVYLNQHQANLVAIEPSLDTAQPETRMRFKWISAFSNKAQLMEQRAYK
jgi:DNA invertase Pin-like site-specific DNA recombinase